MGEREIEERGEGREGGRGKDGRGRENEMESERTKGG